MQNYYSHTKKIFTLFVLMFTLMFTCQLFAQVPSAENKSNSASGEALLGSIGEDMYITMILATEIDLGKIGIGLQAPLNLRVVDKDPKDDSIIRKEDWDEPSEWLRVVRYFRYGHKRDFVYFRIGELREAYIGHATIVNRYYNALDINHFQVGGQLDINTGYGGFETLIDNFMAPELVGGRAYIRPLSFIDKDSYFNGLAIGASLAMDTNAPEALKIGDDGNYVTDDYDQVEAESNVNLPIFGLDVEFELVKSSIIDITPYTDYNMIMDDKVENGTGIHIGTFVTLKLGTPLTVNGKFEYRMFDKDYLPGYFDTQYEISRYYPKLAGLRQLSANAKDDGSLDEGITGWYGELAGTILGFLTIGGSFDDYDGEDNSNLRFWVVVPATDKIEATAEYYKLGFEGFGKIFELDEKSIGELKIKYKINPFISAIVNAVRTYEFNVDKNKFDSIDSYSVGMGFDFPY